MKKTVTLALTILLVLGLLSGCANDTPADNAESTENTNTTVTIARPKPYILQRVFIVDFSFS